MCGRWKGDGEGLEEAGERKQKCRGGSLRGPGAAPELGWRNGFDDTPGQSAAQGEQRVVKKEESGRRYKPQSHLLPGVVKPGSTWAMRLERC